jgi:hypothetical protein
MADKNVRHSAFITYSSADAPLAQQLSKALAKAGVRSWLPDELVGKNGRAEHRLVEELRRAGTVVFLLTPASVRSPWTFFVLGASLAGHKTIIPVLSHDVDPSDLPDALRRLRAVKASPPEEAGQEIARAISSATAEMAGVP